MATAFDRDQLLDAFDRIGAAARQNGTVLHIAVYGGSALMLASNFRFSSEDVDVAELPRPWPRWLAQVVEDISRERGWSPDWLNDAVSVHLSAQATLAGDHLEFASFPRQQEPGLVVYVPTAEYMLALKLKAIRVLDPVKGPQEAEDLRNLMRAAAVTSVEQALAILARFFPRSAADTVKHRFLLKHVMSKEDDSDASAYPLRSL